MLLTLIRLTFSLVSQFGNLISREREREKRTRETLFTERPIYIQTISQSLYVCLPLSYSPFSLFPSFRISVLNVSFKLHEFKNRTYKRKLSAKETA